MLLVAITWAAAAAAAVEEQVCGPDEESCDATKILGTGNNNLEASSACVNDNHRCDYWATSGECEANPSYMHVACPKSCRICKEHKE
jgi:hypothetical protein